MADASQSVNQNPGNGPASTSVRGEDAASASSYVSVATLETFRQEMLEAFKTFSSSMMLLAAAANKPQAAEAQGGSAPLAAPVSRPQLSRPPFVPPPPPADEPLPLPGAHRVDLPAPQPQHAAFVHGIRPVELEARQRDAMNVRQDERSFIDSLVGSINAAHADPDSLVNNTHNNSSSSSFTQYSALLPNPSGLDGTDPLNAVRLALSSVSRSRRPFRTAKELEEALTEAAKKSALTHPGDTARISYLFAYSNFVSTLARENLEAAQAYHFYVAKEEQEGRHVICAPNGHFHAEAYTRHFIQSKVTAAASHTSSSRKRSRRKVSSPPGGHSSTPTYPAGSCKNHPNSTTHKTDDCKSGSKKTKQ